jgi:hypothetical protein
MADIFISYSRKDRGFVLRLNQALQKREYDVWVDLEDIPPTADWMEEVRSGIEGSDAYVFVISPDSIASKVCQEELAHAVLLRMRGGRRGSTLWPPRRRAASAWWR